MDAGSGATSAIANESRHRVAREEARTRNGRRSMNQPPRAEVRLPGCVGQKHICTDIQVVASVVAVNRVRLSNGHEQVLLEGVEGLGQRGRSILDVREKGLSVPAVEWACEQHTECRGQDGVDDGDARIAVRATLTVIRAFQDAREEEVAPEYRSAAETCKHTVG